MIDWAHVDELRADMGDDFDAVVDVFLEEVEEALGTLPDAGVGGADAGGMAAGLHFLKGAALNLGFREFAALCARGEDDANAGRADRVDLGAVRALFDESRTAFLAGLGRRTAWPADRRLQFGASR